VNKLQQSHTLLSHVVTQPDVLNFRSWLFKSCTLLKV